MSEHDDYLIYKLNIQFNSTERQIRNVFQLFENYLQRSFETPNENYAPVIQYCSTSIMAAFHRNSTLSLTNIHGLILGRTEAYDNSKYVCYLSVLKEYRRKRLATRLIQQVVQQSKAENNIRLTLHVNAANQDAIALYRTCGMKCVDIIPNFYINESIHPTSDAFAMMLMMKNVKNASAICLSEDAVQFSNEEIKFYSQRCRKISL